jgi:hypothetical protein
MESVASPEQWKALGRREVQSSSVSGVLTTTASNFGIVIDVECL